RSPKRRPRRSCRCRCSPACRSNRSSRSSKRSPDSPRTEMRTCCRQACEVSAVVRCGCEYSADLMNADHTGRCIPHISVCVCTYKRPLLLRRLLKELSAQDSGGFFTFSIVVVDNDSSGSARPVADDFAAGSPVWVAYCLG